VLESLVQGILGMSPLLTKKLNGDHILPLLHDLLKDETHPEIPLAVLQNLSFVSDVCDHNHFIYIYIIIIILFLIL
jgi:hypothetical protein